MAGSGESERAVARSGGSERAVAGSGGSERAVAGSGDKLAVAGSGLLHSLDYPCTRRLRLRRLLACIRGHSHVDVYIAARQKMYDIFDVKYLVKKVREGQWQDASYYVSCFSAWSYEARLLDVFMFDLLAFKAFAEGQVRMIGYLCDWLMSIYRKPVLDKYPCFATVVADVLFMRKDHASSFLDWQLVRKKAAQLVEKMACEAPEFRDRMQYPRSGNSLYHFMPIGSKKRHNIKHAVRKQPAHLAQFYLQMNRRITSLSPETDRSYSDSSIPRGEDLIALFDTCFEAGRLLGLDGQFPEVLPKEGFPYVQHKLARGFRVISIKQAKLSSKPGTSQRPAVVGSSVTNSGTKRSRCFQESKLDTVHPANLPKRPRTAGKIGDCGTKKCGLDDVLGSYSKMSRLLDEMFPLLRDNAGLKYSRDLRTQLTAISEICNKATANHVLATYVILEIREMRRVVEDMNQKFIEVKELCCKIQAVLQELSSLENMCLAALE